MKKLFRLFLLFIFMFGCLNVYADSKKIELSDISVADKSGTIDVGNPVLNDGNLSSSVTFNKQGDYVIFSLKLKNNDDKKYKVTSIVDNLSNDNISIEYDYSDEYFSSDECLIKIKMTYKNKLLNVDKISLNDLKFTINLEKEDGSKSSIIINNPVTGDNILHYLILLIIFVTGFILSITKKRFKKLKVGNIIIALTIVMLPFAVFAGEKYEVSIKFSNLDIIGEFEKYNITIDPKDGTVPIQKTITYGEVIGDLPDDPVKDGYKFLNWVDEDGNVITPNTVIKGEININASFELKEYDIIYDLAGGNLDGKTNPDKYTVESSDIILNNPKRDGYTFSGWTGSNGGVLQTSVTIFRGSIGDKVYVANYSTNQDTVYTVKHQYKNLGSNTYTEEVIEEHGATDTTVAAPIKHKEGFIDPSVQNVKITGDGKASVTYVYNREEYTLNVTDRTYLDSTSSVNGTYQYGSTITLKASESEERTFVKWSNGETSNPYIFEMNSNLTIEPIYYFHYTIDFDSNGGSNVSSIDVTAGDSIAILPSTNRDGYTFDGWFTELDGGTKVLDGYTPSSKGTLYAHWYEGVRTFSHTGACTFNGGNAITGDDCEFAGQKYIDTRVRLYNDRNWKEDYEIGFTIVGGTYDPDIQVKQAVFVNAKYEKESIKWPGLVFRRFNTSSNVEVTQTINMDNKEYKEFDSLDYSKDINVRIYRKDKKIYYKINNGELTFLQDMSNFNQQFEVSTWFGASPNESGSPMRYLKATLSNMYVRLGTVQLPEPTCYNVVFNPNGGTVNPTSKQVCNEGNIGDLPIQNAPENRDFEGWYTSLENGVEVDSTYVPTGDMELIAKYGPKKIEISFNSNGGSDVDSIFVLPGESIGTLPTATKSEYYLDGWYTGLTDGIKVDENYSSLVGVTLFAHWIPKNAILLMNGEYYDSFQKAVDEDVTGTTTMTLIKDASVSSYVNLYTKNTGKDFIIDLNGHTVTAKKSQFIRTKSKIEIKNGTIYCEADNAAVDVGSNGQFIMNSGSIIATGSRQAIYNEGGIVEIGGTTHLSATPEVLSTNMRGTVHNVSGTLKITGGTIESDNYAVSVKKGTFTLGVKDDEYDTSSLKIIGGVNGIYSDVNYSVYDGLIMGVESAVNNESKITAKEDNFSKENGSETIESVSYNTLYYAFKYTVTLNPNGGSVDPTSLEVNKGSSVGDLPTPTAPNGKTFDGWYTNLTNGVKVDSTYKPNDDITLFAKYNGEDSSSFEDDDWSTIASNVRQGNISNYNVGDTKTIEMDVDGNGTPETYTLRIANTSTPEECSQEEFSKTACGFVLEFVDIITTRRMNPYTNGSTNGDGNKGGWEYSEMRSYVNNDIYNLFPTEIKNAIIDTTVVSGHGSNDSNNFTTTDKLYLLSTKEVGFDVGYDTAKTETRILDYYNANNNGASRIKKYNSSNCYWWLRSAISHNSDGFYYIYSGGTDDYYGANNTRGVAPAFRIGKKE